MSEGLSGAAIRRLMTEMVEGRLDVAYWARRGKLPGKALRHWLSKGEELAVLGGLCTLADLQTRLMLARYQLHAATRLIKLATSEETDSAAKADVTRKACVDLLRMELAPRAEVDEAEDEFLTALRQMQEGNQSQRKRED